MSVNVSAIFLYPVKGLHGYPVERAFVERRGLRDDRRWMVVGPDGVFRTQRDHPVMATIRTSVDSSGLALMRPSSSVRVPLEPAGQEVAVQVWKSTVLARFCSEEADRWLSGQLGEPVRLVKMGADSVRETSPQYSQPGDHVSFADGFPLLLASVASLEDLNSRMEVPVPMSRFRTNLVVAGSDPWAEDAWARIRVGQVRFRYAKPCGRCSVTTVDQDTGLPMGDEPLRTLATFRKVGNAVNFGANLIPDVEGWVGVGDAVSTDQG